MALQLTEEQLRDNVRYDTEAKRFSLIDVISLVCGLDNDKARLSLRYIMDTQDRFDADIGNRDSFPDCSEPPLKSRVSKYKFPGQRQRETPVADFATCCEIISMLGGRRAAHFRRTAMITLARAFAGDLSLAAKIQEANAALAGTELQAALLEGTGVDPAEANRIRAGAAEALHAEEDLYKRVEALAVRAASVCSNPVLRDAYRAYNAARLDDLNLLTGANRGTGQLTGVGESRTLAVANGDLAMTASGLAAMQEETGRAAMAVTVLERNQTSLECYRNDPIMRNKMLARVYDVLLNEIPPWWHTARAADGKEPVTSEWTGVKGYKYGSGGLEFKTHADMATFDRKVLDGMEPNLALTQCGGRVLDAGELLQMMSSPSWLSTHRAMKGWTRKRLHP